MPEELTPADSGAIPEEGPSSTGDSPHGDLSAALSSCQITWQHAESWNEFIEALATVETTSMQDGHIALHDVCIALRERIVHLSEVQPCPDDEQCAVLATWPSFASAWAESTGDTRLGELLVEFLRHPMWSQPLGSDEAEVLGVMLGVESGAYGTESLIETVIDTLYTGETDDGDGDVTVTPAATVAAARTDCPATTASADTPSSAQGAPGREKSFPMCAPISPAESTAATSRT